MATSDHQRHVNPANEQYQSQLPTYDLQSCFLGLRFVLVLQGHANEPRAISRVVDRAEMIFVVLPLPATEYRVLWGVPTEYS